MGTTLEVEDSPGMVWASRPDPAKMVELEGVGRQIEQWKREHVWFRDYYEKY